jgi:hypothetical protein
MDLVRAWAAGTYDRLYAGKLVEVEVVCRVYGPVRPSGSHGYAAGPYTAVGHVGDGLLDSVGLTFPSNPGFPPEGSKSQFFRIPYGITARGRCLPSLDIREGKIPVLGDCQAVKFGEVHPKLP